MNLLRVVPLLVALGGCNSLLDLDAAHLDPSIGEAGGTTGESGAPSSSGGEGGAPEAASICEQYCRAITDGCTEETTQYTDYDACLVTCPYFPEGARGDTTGNTLNCRLNYALKAASEPITYCTWAGPGGDGMCGSNCEGFCTLMSGVCTPSTTRAPTDYFATTEDCLSTCATIPAEGPYSAISKSTAGGADIYECRLYHVAAAIYAEDAALHCPHAMGRQLCVDR